MKALKEAEMEKIKKNVEDSSSDERDESDNYGEWDESTDR